MAGNGASGALTRGLLAMILVSGCGAEPEPGVVEVHYLGHASFILTFGESLTVLTDYGASRAYGLDSPVHPLGEVLPDIVTRSHEHEDHAGGVLPEGVPVILAGVGPHTEAGLTITPIPTHEGNLDTPDNFSFLFEYRGLRILHLGDCQALMGHAETPAVAERIRALYPHRYDLVLLPIGSVQDILTEASEFAALLDARFIVPMHYWSPEDRARFLEMMEGKEDSRRRAYSIRHVAVGSFQLQAPGEPSGEGSGVVEILALDPGPPG